MTHMQAVAVALFGPRRLGVRPLRADIVAKVFFGVANENSQSR
jgi:hypothetical protein